MKNEDRNELGETLEEFLDNYDPSLFERPSVTVDTLIFTKRNRKLQVLLIKRKIIRKLIGGLYLVALWKWMRT